MKKISCSSRNKKIACTISAAALMLGVSSAATIGLHFQENYCSAQAYSGYPVTMTAFGIRVERMGEVCWRWTPVTTLVALQMLRLEYVN